MNSQYYVAFALANLSSNPENHAILTEEGGLQPLVSLAYSQDVDVHMQVFCVFLCFLCFLCFFGGYFQTKK